MEPFLGPGPKFMIRFLGPTLDQRLKPCGQQAFARPRRYWTTSTQLTSVVACRENSLHSFLHSHQPVPLQSQSIGKSQGLEGLPFVIREPEGRLLRHLGFGKPKGCRDGVHLHIFEIWGPDMVSIYTYLRFWARNGVHLHIFDIWGPEWCPFTHI